MRHSQDTYTMEDGRKFRCLNDNILVRIDKAKEISDGGLIHFPSGSMDDVNNTGTILAFGSLRRDDGLDVPIPDLEVGMKCCFIRFLAEQDSNKQLRYRIGEGIIRIKPEDILYVSAE